MSERECVLSDFFFNVWDLIMTSWHDHDVGAHSQEERWIISDALMHVCCDDDAIISAVGIGGITYNPFQIISPAARKSGSRSSSQV